MKLHSLHPGERAIVTQLHDITRDYRHKLMAMGLTRGAEFTVMRIAPLGDPIQIEIRGVVLALRKGEAMGLECERLESV